MICERATALATVGETATITARNPRMPDGQYREIIHLVAGLGYDVSRIQRVPQRW